jgi:hypothetical protein
MSILVHGQEPDTAVTAAIADGIRLFLLVGDAVDKSQFSGTLKDILGFLACYLTAHAVFHYIASQLIKVQADLGRVLAIR